MESEEPPVVPFKTKAKPKKERTEAQKAATAKALGILREKREALKKREEEELAQLDEEDRSAKLKEKAAKQRKASKLPPIVNYVSTADLERFKRDIFAALPKEIIREVPVEKIREKVISVPQEIVRERVIEQPVPVPVVKHLTGNELLDKIFFNK